MGVAGVRLQDYVLNFEEGAYNAVIMCEVLEHLNFKQEPKFLYEVKRVLQKGGIFKFRVPDFEEVCSIWLNSKDDWQGFFSDDI